MEAAAVFSIFDSLVVDISEGHGDGLWNLLLDLLHLFDHTYSSPLHLLDGVPERSNVDRLVEVLNDSFERVNRGNSFFRDISLSGLDRDGRLLPNEGYHSDLVNHLQLVSDDRLGLFLRLGHHAYP